MNDEPEENDGSSDEKTSSKNEIVGIHVIEAIVTKVSEISNPDKIYSAINQILFFYKYIPPEWKRKAYFILERLWNRKKVVISTDPEKPEKVYETYEMTFEDERINKLFSILPPQDKSIMLLGKTVMDLLSKGLHAESDRVKIEVETKYDVRGLTIVHMITTGDINYVLDDIGTLSDSKATVGIFNKWVAEYDSIALLISPYEIKDLTKVEEKILTISKRAIKNYILVHISGEIDDVNKITTLIYSMKESKKLKYDKFEPAICDSGFYKALNAKILFK